MNKLIIVTGGTKGIGRAIVDRFAAEDFDIITCARTAPDLEELKQNILRQNPLVQVFVKAVDMADVNDVKNFCRFVEDMKRPIDVLVNNAGFFIPGEITTEPEGTLESMIKGNLYSAYYTTRGLIQGMKENRRGHVFNICSIASTKAYSNGGSYAISKFAMLGFSKCLREELKSFGIRVTAVMPGATFTSSWEGVDLPEDRFMPATDIAETIYSAYSLSGRSVVEEIIIRPQLGDI